ncbi:MULTISPECIES: helix-turn-helix transcriptional regulator [Asticcacaulis]|jgi:ArsR family transcriptional regulator, arsenate/arsenite/antimonite-responsive transcriptional repressor|uniref:ArsR/SmtB family transcription factor n=1 Tax=Asticcacaulis TaxID=76890 RepID=UPI001AE7CE25|nr:MULTISPECIES: metalloregulator ArsR/SmtB family transcription factor [Asticcacaulis]MBP2160551.1 DNA-binding transcriptional ArsR family regulator [Asticcacaulis solisilvae]MDR6801596.1 DNA-binding transcriptional ArsR family regulator [Asticcacaulis sp. BE141]
MDKTFALSAFDALSQETRLDALRLLIQAGPEGLPAGEIGERLGIKQNTMSVNLKILTQAGLITSTREGRIIRYAASYDAIQGILLFLMKDCCGGRKDLCQPVLDQMRCC